MVYKCGPYTVLKHPHREYQSVLFLALVLQYFVDKGLFLALAGVYTSRGFSPESSSDSGNETNSSEMTEISELAATHRLSESHMRLLVATREGYQPLLEEKTEFPVSPSSGVTVQKKPSSPTQHLQPPAIPPRRSPQPDAGPPPAPLNLEVRLQAHLSSTLQRPSSTTPGGKHHRKSADSGGKYNTFSTRDGHRGEGTDGRGHLDFDQRTSFREHGESQRRLEKSADSLAREHRRVPRPPSSTSDNLLDFNQANCGSGNGNSAEQDEHLVVASLLSPTKKPRVPEQGPDVQGEHPPMSRQQSVARLCEYHLAKRISTLQGEAHSSLQGSLCSSLDAGGGGSTSSSVCATPTDSPLGPGGALESKHHHQQQQHHLQRHPLSSSSSSLLRVLNHDDGGKQGKDPHPHADPALLRKMLPNIHPPTEQGRPSSATPSKHREPHAGGKRSHNDLQAKQQACLKGLNQKEGSEAYRQLINYLTVSQMHQGGKLHGAGMGAAVKKDTRRFITSNPQLVEMVKNRGNTIGRCPCAPSSGVTSPLLNPNFAAQTSGRGSRAYHSATLPAKLKRSTDVHSQGPGDCLDFGTAAAMVSERRSSFSGLDMELERGGVDSEHFLSLCKGEGCADRSRPPPRSRSQPGGGSTDDWFRSEGRGRHAARQLPNDSSFSAVGGHNTLSLGRDHVSAFTRQASTGSRSCIASPTPNSHPSPPPPPPLPAQGNCISSGNCHSGTSGCQQNSLQPRQLQNHVQAAASPAPLLADTCSLQRGRTELRRSCSNTTPTSGSMDALFDKGAARSRGQQPPSPSAPQQQQQQQGDAGRVQRRPTRKRLSKSYSQGSVSSSHATNCWPAGGRGDSSRRASVAFPLQKDAKGVKGSQKLEASPWRCNGPFSYCFFKRRSEGEEDEIEWERPRRSRSNLDGGEGVGAIFPCGAAVDVAGEQLYGEVLNNMSFSDRLARINALKDRMYGHPSGFTDVRRDASELIALVRSSVGRCDRGPQMPFQDVSQFKHLLSIESKELGRACRRMAQAHASPEEMLLAVTCSFQVLCCLCEACMCLVRSLGATASHQQREVVAKVDEVVMNYICLLKAAEAATVGAPGEHSVKALVRHSSTMSAIANALTRSLKTLLSK